MENSTNLQNSYPTEMNVSWLSESVRNKSLNELSPTQQQVRLSNIEIFKKQKDELSEFKDHAAMSPPSYPILVYIKYYNTTAKKDMTAKSMYWLMDKDNNYLYASSFQDATAQVKLQIKSPNTKLQNDYRTSYPGCGYLRMSSDNIKKQLQVSEFDLVKDSNYQYWQIWTTSNAPSFLSNVRQSIRGGRKMKKGKKSRSNRKSKRRMR
jgi:hypothetical protein